MGGALAALSALGGANSRIVVWGTSAPTHTTIAPTNAVATVTYATTGVLSSTGEVDGTWKSGPAAASEYWIYVGQISGGAITNAATWLQLNVGRSFSISQTVVGVNNAVGDFFVQRTGASPGTVPTQASPAGSTFAGRATYNAEKEA